MFKKSIVFKNISLCGLLRPLILFVFLALSAQVQAQNQTQDQAGTTQNSPNGDFQAWVGGLRAEGLEKGISAATLDEALKDLAPIPRIIELDRSQPEFTLTLGQYLNRVVPASRVAKGRQKLLENRDLLENLERRYGVPGRFIVAFWGVETDFGRVSGGFNVIRALATLAYDGRRSAYFRKELFNALTIIDQGHIKFNDMKGSWAGAMGQTQFMPSTFLNHATDFDNDGRKDLWGTRDDALASAANYLKNAGWNQDLTWGREVSLPPGFDRSLSGKDVKKSLAQWQDLGVRRLDGKDLPIREISGTILLPEKKSKAIAKQTPEGATPAPVSTDERAFLIYDNFDVILDWNRSNFFAIAIGQLADRMNRP